MTSNKDRKVKADQMIFDAIFKAIDDAEEFIVIDLFLFNGYYDKGETYPKISEELTKRLLQKKKDKPDMDIVFITDDINTSYGSHPYMGFRSFSDLLLIKMMITDRIESWINASSSFSIEKFELFSSSKKDF